MARTRNVEPNVQKFLDRAAADIGRLEASIAKDFFGQMIYECVTHSPIEDIFFAAVHVVCKSALIDVNPAHRYSSKGERLDGYGCQMQTQVCIGKYRVDFLLQGTGGDPGDPEPTVIVELDGHAFHDKDKKQRAAEKQRDRFLVGLGFKILHFTGSEVVADPYAVAHEALRVAMPTAFSDDLSELNE